VLDPVVQEVDAVKVEFTEAVPEIVTHATGAIPVTTEVAALVADDDPPVFVNVALTFR
jgi:hypothetical protein